MKLNIPRLKSKRTTPLFPPVAFVLAWLSFLLSVLLAVVWFIIVYIVGIVLVIFRLYLFRLLKFCKKA